MNLRYLNIAIACSLLISLASAASFNAQADSLFLKEVEKAPSLQKRYVFSRYQGGRLGNQLFQIAAALSLSMDNKAVAVFPDYSVRKECDIAENKRYIFPKICTFNPNVKRAATFKEHQDFHFKPIPFTSNMTISGFFQSEKYFKHNWEKIRPYFAPSEEIIGYLKSKYFNLLNHPNTVAMHIRGYLKESPGLKDMFASLDINYFAQAASFFEDDALFVIFSDDILGAKRLLKNFSRPYVVIEKEKHYHDFYLMSLMKHQIISNSSFSWWAAYLNDHQDKIVIAPYPWFHPKHHLSSKHIIPENWVVLPVSTY